MRWVNDAGWVLGGVTRIRTEGTGDSLLDELADIDVRKWRVEVAPLISWRGWPVHFELKWYNEIFSNFGGPTTEFMISLPREHPWGWFVPSVTVVNNSAGYNRYYYGVSESEAGPNLEPYSPGAGTNFRAGISTGYAINSRWLLSVTLNHEWLASEITGSPIVDKNSVWSGSIGIAYNNDIFRTPDYAGELFRSGGFEFRIGMYTYEVHRRKSTSRMSSGSTAGRASFISREFIGLHIFTGSRLVTCSSAAIRTPRCLTRFVWVTKSFRRARSLT